MGRFALVIAVAAVAGALNATPALAQAVRTFVSGHGADSGTCGVGSPCRTFAYAATQTNPGGSVVVLDNAGYGAVTITKAVNIVSGDGVIAGITVPANGIGVTINAGSSDVVTLHGLTIEGSGSNTLGVQFNTGGALHVQNSVFRNLAGGCGICFYPTTQSDLFVSDSAFSDIGSGSAAVYINPLASGEFTAALNHVTMENNFDGVMVFSSSMETGSIALTIADSMIARSSDMGVFVGAPGVYGIATITNSSIVNGCSSPCSRYPNSIGLNAQSQLATIRLRHSAVLQNATGWQVVAGGHVESYGDNNIDFNAAGNTAPPAFSLK
jgi:hypothetical protein